MATKAVVSNGIMISVYDDRFRDILEAVGPLHIERATDVEFDGTTGNWVAVHLSTGTEIARGRNRGDVINQEIQFLEREVIR